MRTARKATRKRVARRILAPLTVIDWRKYCYDDQYKDIFKYDYSNETERVRMAKLGYMQLTLCKMLTDQYGNDVADRLQFKRLDETSSEVLYFQTWKEVKDFCHSEEFTREMLSEQEKTSPETVKQTEAKVELHDEFVVQQKDSSGEWRSYSFVDTSPGPLVGALRAYAEENPGFEFRVAGRKVTEWVDIKDFKTDINRPSSITQLEKARHYTARDAKSHLKKIELEHLKVDPRMLAILKKRSTAGTFE